MQIKSSCRHICETSSQSQQATANNRHLNISNLGTTCTLRVSAWALGEAKRPLVDLREGQAAVIQCKRT